MKEAILAALLLFACIPHLCAQARGDTLTGDALLERSRAAYAHLSSYTGVTTVLSELAVGDTVIAEATSAEIHFDRPARFRISGRGSKGVSYQVSSGGAKARVALVASDPMIREGLVAMGELMGLRPVGGDTVANDTLSARMAVAMVTGIGNGAPYFLPALLGLVDGTPLAHHTPSVLVGQEAVAGVECYKVVIRGSTLTRTYWIDTRTYLLRQLQDEQSGAQFAGSLERAGALMAEQDTSSNPLVSGVSAMMTSALRQMPRTEGSSVLVRFVNLQVDAQVDSPAR